MWGITLIPSFAAPLRGQLFREASRAKARTTTTAARTMPSAGISGISIAVKLVGHGMSITRMPFSWIVETR